MDGIVVERIAIGLVVFVMSLTPWGVAASQDSEAQPEPQSEPQSTSLRAATVVRLAVTALDEHEVPAGFGWVVVDMIVLAVDAPGVEILDRRTLASVLDEQALATSDLSQPGEAVRFGRIARATHVLKGAVYRFEGTYFVSCCLVNVVEGTVDPSRSGAVQFNQLDELTSAAADLARQMGLRGDAMSVAPEPSKPSQPADSSEPSDSAEPAPGYVELFGTGRSGDLEVLIGDGRRIVAVGDPLRFTFKASRDGYLSIYFVDAAGRVGTLVPNDRLGSIPVLAGSRIRIPEDVPFKLSAIAPLGVTRIRAVITDAPLPVGKPASTVLGGDESAVSVAELEFVVVPSRSTATPTATASSGSPAGPSRENEGARPRADLRARLAIVSEVFSTESRPPSNEDIRVAMWSRGGLDQQWGTQGISWRATPVGTPIPRIAVIDADFDPDDIALAGAFAQLSPRDREALRSRLRQVGSVSWSHGNRVASLIAGLAPWLPSGIPGAAIIPIPITSMAHGPEFRVQRGSATEIIRALQLALDAGCRVINISAFADLTPSEFDECAGSPIWRRLDDARAVVVCAAGNHGENLDRMLRFPASLPFTNIVTVGAASPSGGLAEWDGGGSAYGHKTVDLFAPGSCLLASDGDRPSPPIDGSSYACPLAAAATAVLMAQHPDDSAAEIVDRLVASSLKTPALQGLGRGGLLQWPQSPAPTAP
ncbi:MAG: S8 family serine peptidase [Planctomycetota bacterium]|nr:S8 family serine peptidase [Planctomycetota bacterium]